METDIAARVFVAQAMYREACDREADAEGEAGLSPVLGIYQLTSSLASSSPALLRLW